MNELELEHRLTVVEKLAGSNKHRIDDLEADTKILQSLSQSTAVMAEQLKAMNEKVTDLSKSVAEINSKPGNLWESAIKAVITALLAGLVAYGLAKAGLR